MKWRMETLKDVFSLPPDYDISDLYYKNKEYYIKHLKDKSHIMVLAYEDDKKIGCGAICFYDELPSPDNPDGKCAYLMNIYVKPEYRRHGAGKHIVEYLVNQSLKRGCAKIYLETSLSGASVYKSVGFKNMEYYMIYDKGKSNGEA